jgi:hypothetical protein
MITLERMGVCGVGKSLVGIEDLFKLEAMRNQEPY